MTLAEHPAAVHHLPILTTALAAVFLVVLIRRASQRGWPWHSVWWAIGVFTYGLGTALESSVTLFGNSPELTRWWYWAGAILGGYPLATGTVYLLLRARVAHILTGVSLAVVVAASVLVFLSPLNVEAVQPHRPSGDVIGWSWIRLCTPIINGYAALFLVGGAVYSSIRFAMTRHEGRRAAGTALIALGGLLPGIGGGMAKAGIVEALYIGELVGLILIWIGFHLCTRPGGARAPCVGGGESENA